MSGISVKDRISNLFRKGPTCTICGYRGEDFGEVGVSWPEHLRGKVAGGYNDKVLCPSCGAFERIRFIDYVLANYTNVYTGNSRVLHIAPEPLIKKKIMMNIDCQYIDGDNDGVWASQIIDVTDMDFEDDYFDYIIINHVLEHIRDDGKAIGEMVRCIKPDGKIIFSFPVRYGSDTEEDASIDTDEGRIWHYGQNDHLRLYGENDIGERFLKYGLEFKTIRSKDEFTKRTISKYAFPENDYIFIGHKSIC